MQARGANGQYTHTNRERHHCPWPRFTAQNVLVVAQLQAACFSAGKAGSEAAVQVYASVAHLSRAAGLHARLAGTAGCMCCMGPAYQPAYSTQQATYRLWPYVPTYFNSASVTGPLWSMYMIYAPYLCGDITPCKQWPRPLTQHAAWIAWQLTPHNPRPGRARAAPLPAVDCQARCQGTAGHLPTSHRRPRRSTH